MKANQITELLTPIRKSCAPRGWVGGQDASVRLRTMTARRVLLNSKELLARFPLYPPEGFDEVAENNIVACVDEQGIYDMGRIKLIGAFKLCKNNPDGLAADLYVLTFRKTRMRTKKIATLKSALV